MNVKETANKNKTLILVIALMFTLLSPLYAKYLGTQNIDQQFLENLERMQKIEETLSTSWNPTFYALQNPNTYTIDKLGTYYTMQNGTTGALKYRSTNQDNVLQFAIGNLSTTYGGTIFIKENISFGNISITYPNVCIVTEHLRSDNTDYPVRIGNLTLDSSGRGIYGIRIQGIQLAEMVFYSETNVIGYVHVEDCVIKNNATYQGLRFLGTAYIYFVKFIDCTINDYNSNAQAIQWNNDDSGNGQIYFTRLNYKTYASNCTMFRVGSGGTIQCGLFFTEMSYVIGTATDGSKMFIQEASGDIVGLQVANSWLEIQSNCTLFTIANSTATSIQHVSDFHDNNILLHDNTVRVLTVLDNNADTGDFTYTTNILHFHDNVFTKGNTANFALNGTSLSKFKLSIEHNKNICVTEAWLTNTTANDGGIQPHGLIGIPTTILLTSGNNTINVICGWIAKDAYSFTYNLEDDASTAVNGQTVATYVRYDP